MPIWLGNTLVLGTLGCALKLGYPPLYYCCIVAFRVRTTAACPIMHQVARHDLLSCTVNIDRNNWRIRASRAEIADGYGLVVACVYVSYYTPPASGYSSVAYVAYCQLKARLLWARSQAKQCVKASLLWTSRAKRWVKASLLELVIPATPDKMISVYTAARSRGRWMVSHLSRLLVTKGLSYW